MGSPMKPPSFRNFLLSRESYIAKKFRQRLARLPSSPYKLFLFKTKEGGRRMVAWIDLLIQSLESDHEAFFIDGANVGYVRSQQGFSLDFNYQVHNCLSNVIEEVIAAALKKGDINYSDALEWIKELHSILLKNHSTVAASFIQAREESIAEKITYLQTIYDFSRKIITILDISKLIDFTLTKLAHFFMVEKSVILLARDGHAPTVYSYPLNENSGAIRSILNRTLSSRTPYFLPNGRKKYTSTINQPELIQLVSIPIIAHGQCYGAIALMKNDSGFNFTDKELTLLYQIIHVMVIAFENALMLEEIQKKRL
jgi:hypothetical protein